MKRLVALLSAILLVACAPQEQALKPQAEPAAFAQGAFVTGDGDRLPMRSWPVKNPKAVVVALHGFNDYSNAFEDTGKYFRKRGIATYAYDQRGFGAGPYTGIWANEENLTRDLKDFTALVAKRHPHIPLYILGESMGGAVAMVADKEYKLPVSGIALVAPAVWGNGRMPVFYRVLLWGMAHTLPQYEMTGRNLRILASNNIPMLRQMGKDPLVIKSTRIDSMYGLVHLMDHAYGAPEQMHHRVLLLYGYKDQVIPRDAVEDVEPRFAPSVKAIYYDNGYHMLTRDLQGKEVLSDIAAWMLKS